MYIYDIYIYIYYIIVNDCAYVFVILHRTMQWMSKSESLMSISNIVCINLFFLVWRASQKVWKMLGKASKNKCKTSNVARIEQCSTTCALRSHVGSSTCSWCPARIWYLHNAKEPEACHAQAELNELQACHAQAELKELEACHAQAELNVNDKGSSD